MTNTPKHEIQDESDDEIEMKSFKIIFLGDGAVGKTSIIHRFTEDHFDPEQKYKQTIGLDFYMKRIELNPSLQVSLQCWDIGGQTIGQKMIRSYLRGSNAVLFIYDITVQESFDNLEKWKAFVDEVFPGDKRPYMALIGNKTDLGYKRVVSLDAHTNFSKQYKIPFFYMSARTGDNVTPAMYKIASELCGIKRPFTDLQAELSIQSAATVQRVGQQEEKAPKAEQKSTTISPSKKEKKNCAIL